MNVLSGSAQEEFCEETRGRHDRGDRHDGVLRLAAVGVDAWGLRWQYATPEEQYNMMTEGNAMGMRLFTEGELSPYERAQYPQKETYLWERMSVHEVVEDICDLNRGDLDEDLAGPIYDNLDETKVRQHVERWFDEQDEGKYNEWYHDRYSWPEE